MTDAAIPQSAAQVVPAPVATPSAITVKSAVSTKKCSKELAEYIWTSPCIRPFFFNPFLLSMLIIAVMLAIDHLDGKVFTDTSLVAMVQHIFTVFVSVSILLVMNNILIKYKYRQEKEEIKSLLDKPHNQEQINFV